MYWTIVRDLVSGAVLHVDKGKEGDSLKSFLFRLHCSKAKIELVAMDMGAAYTLWVKENLPGAAIVFDHFHKHRVVNIQSESFRFNEFTDYKLYVREAYRELNRELDRTAVFRFNIMKVLLHNRIHNRFFWL